MQHDGNVSRRSNGNNATRGHLHLLWLAVAVCCCLSGAQAALSFGARTWTFFNIESYSFVGSWSNVTYHSQVWLRNVCHNRSSNTLRMLVSIHNAPYIIPSPERVHSLTPSGFLKANGTLPLVWLESDNGQLSVTATVLNQYDELVKQQEDAAALVLTAELPADVPFTLRMEGSERVHYLPSRCSPRVHPLFIPQSVWLGVVDGSTARAAAAVHTRLAGQPPPAAVRQMRNSSEAADEHSLSDELLQELASLIDLTGSSSAEFSGAAAVVDDRAIHEDTTSSDNSKVGIDENDIYALMAQLQGMQQRRLLHEAPSVTSSVMTPAQQGVAAAAAATPPVRYSRKAHMQMKSARHDTTAETAQGPSSSSSSEGAGDDRQYAGHSQATGPSGTDSDSKSDSSSSAATALEVSPRGAVLRFLTLQHLAHHTNLGFSGTIMVVTQHTADQLMRSRSIRKAVQRQRLVLVIWDLGLEPRASHFMQVPAYNLLKLAAWGSTAALGFWDLDEYLVLPHHKPVSHEVFQGCMQRTLRAEPEAVIRSMWVRSDSWKSSPELAGWMQQGSLMRALQKMNYSMFPYTFCDGACKAIVDPNSDLLFQVHQHARPPPREAVVPVNWRCGYMLHFYQLWSRRAPELMAAMYEAAADDMAGVPLILEDIVPQALIKHLASAAHLYETMISSNPTLADRAVRPS